MTTSESYSSLPEPRHIAVIGDVSGYLDPLLATLRELRVDLDTSEIPEGLAIVQLGDLVHKGPDSDVIVELVDRLMLTNESRWIQLVGNHEAHHLDKGPKLPAHLCNCSDDTEATLRSWADESVISVGVAIEADDGSSVLVTHAGLGSRAWERLGRPSSAADAAALLNRQFLKNPEAAMQAGMGLGNRETIPSAVWALAPTEVYESWMGDVAPPFDQVHGHSQVYYWHGKRWTDGLSSGVQAITDVDTSRRFTRTSVGAHTFTAIDPGFGSRRESVAESIRPFKAVGRVVSLPLGLDIPSGPDFRS